MADARKVQSYRYVQGTSAAPSAYDDDDDYRDYEEDYDDDDFEALPTSGHSPLGSSKTLQYAAASAGHSPSGGSKTLQYAYASSSRPPGIPTFDTITEAVNKLQSRYSSPSSSIPNAAPPHPTVREPTPPYERPPSTASSASSFTVATDYAAPLKINQANRLQSTTRPLSQQPPSLPTIDSGQPLHWDTMDFIEEQDDPFSDRPPSRQRATPPYPYHTHQRHSSDSSSSRGHTRENFLPGGVNYPPRPPSQLSAASSSIHRGPSPLQSAGTPPLQVVQLPTPSQEDITQPTVGLVSRPDSAQYNPFHSQALTPPANRMIQRRSPAKALTPIDHFRHDTEAYASGRNSLPAFAVPRSRSPTPAPADDGYEAAGMLNGQFTGTTHPADTHYTGSQYTEETVGIDGGEDDGESTDGEDEEREGKDSEKEKEKPKSKFQEYLAKARTQALLDPEPTTEEKATPQNIFADPRRVVFPIPKSTMMLEDSDVPGTPVETRHFGPAPTGRVARRNKTTKRVPLTNGNLVLDLPVPPKLVLPRVGHPEVMKTRYTAVTCDPDDFEQSGHFLRQNQMNRRTELFICITMYNVSFPCALKLGTEQAEMEYFFIIGR